MNKDNTDITTGKVVVNGIEITSVEDWEKVINSLDKLQNNWKELKEWLKQIQDYHIIQKGKCDNEFNYSLEDEDINVLQDVLNKMQEIESRK